ncbi:hypothetical protein T484DRAFT_1860049 [Baffinella frigidus]|nr:hypothetical protein T484DRAFT_1860049 [Cryptophyta sp. CCMP2293]
MAWAFLPQPARRVRWRLLCLALALSVSDVNPANAHGSVGSKPRQDLGRHPPGSPLRPLNRNALGGASPKAGGDTRGGKLKITGTASSSEDEEEEEAPVAQKRTAAAGQVRGEKKRKGEAGAVPARKEPPHAKKDRPPSKQPPAKQTPGAAPVHGIFKSAITAPAAGASGTDKTRKAPAPAAAVSGTDKIRKAPAVAVAVSAADKVKKAAAGGAPFISSPTFVSSVPGYVFKKNKSNGLGYYKDVLPGRSSGKL